MDQTVFNQPAQAPAISAKQQGQGPVQQATAGTISNILPKLPQSQDADYSAYKLAQQARGMPVLPKSSWQMVYRHQQLIDGGA